ncbi:WD40_repeat protein [Hexamita inflata]|uniref:Cleavage stimulation factor 50 kDa subunit n=1 Tax=Hexamita inflata TaxID=28002 RepID=A0ABP1GDG1_9EUKA
MNPLAELLLNECDFGAASLLPSNQIKLSEHDILHLQSNQQNQQLQQLQSVVATQLVTPLPQFAQTMEYCESKSKEKLNFARFSYNGLQIISGAKDHCCKVLDVTKARLDNQTKMQRQFNQGDTQRFRRTFYGHTDSVTDGCISPSHELLVSCSHDTELRFYNLNEADNDSLIYSETLGQLICSMDFLSSSQLLCGLENGQVLVFDLERRLNYATEIANNGSIKKLRAKKGTMGLLSVDRYEQRDLRFNGHAQQILGQFNDFQMMQDRVLIASPVGGLVYDIRNTHQPMMQIPGMSISCSSMFYDQYYLGIDPNGRLLIHTNDGSPVQYFDSQLQRKYNLSQVNGSPVEKTFCYIYDKTFYCVDAQ